jgi:aminoglycoside phosphotransferase
MSHYQPCMIPFDNTLNHLHTSLDAEKMKAVFQQQLYADKSQTILTCTIERIKYKPQKNCYVSYRLTIRNNHLKKIFEQLLCARFYARDGSKSRFLKECNKVVAADTLLHIPELDCVTWVFPNDRKLAYLAQVTDPEFLNREVAPLLIAHYDDADWSLVHFQATMIRYVPEQSCSVRAELAIQHNRSERCHNFVVYGKTSYNRSGQKVLQLMRQLWETPACREQQLNIPQPLLYLPQLQMLWQVGVPGTTLSELLDQQTLFIESVVNVAGQLARLHQLPLTDAPRMELENQQLALQKVGKLIFKFNAPARDQITQLIVELTTASPSMQSNHLATLHGDLHLKNILVDVNRVYLIDLDNLCVGSPLQDIGSFIAVILNLKLLGSMPAQQAEQTIKAFLQSYNDAVPWIINDSQLRRYIAMALIVERISRSFTRLKAGRMEIITDLAEQAERVLDASFTPDWLKLSR